MSDTAKSASNREARLTAKREENQQQPLADWGFFGPESVGYQVWLYPTSVSLGFLRAVSVEFLDPHLTAAVMQTDQVRQRTQLRYDRTLQYFAAVLYADAETVLKYSDMLMKIHSRAHGHDPVTGKTFDANNPDSQLWIHMTAWHSILKMYEKFGPGKLSRQDEVKYWEDCAKAAEFQTMDPDKVPRSREAVRAYFRDWRPRNTATEGGQQHYDFLVNGIGNISSQYDDPKRRFAGKILNFVTSRAILSTLPEWANTMGGQRVTAFDQAFMTVFGNFSVRFAHKFLSDKPKLVMKVVADISPLSYPILDPIFMKQQPLEDKVYDIAEAREKFGHTVSPIEQFAAYQEARAQGKGPKPYIPRHHDAILSFD
ncbi:oxygenase MpaB family protein [Renibacterium salmoninarum]|nr:oxygenase MpaB family protein [Renibacterium salmoninarum]